MIGTMGDQTASLSARLAAIPVAVIADVLRVAGLPDQVLSRRIARLGPGRGVAGPACCVRGALATPGTRLPAGPRYEMFRRMVPGGVLVMASGGYDECVVFGENVALAHQVRGCAAIVADGGVRDAEGLAALGLPIFCRFVTPVSSGGRWNIVALDEPVEMPGQTAATVTVHPGDLVVGDGDGVIVIPGAAAATVMEDAETLVGQEATNRARLQRGDDPEAVYAAFDRFAHVRRMGPRGA